MSITAIHTYCLIDKILLKRCTDSQTPPRSRPRVPSNFVCWKKARPSAGWRTATAATAAGDIAIARDAVRQLRAIWHGADTTLPELAELARLEASLPQ